MDTLTVVFIVLASINILINIVKVVLLDNKADNLNSIAGWLCAIIFASMQV